MKLKAELWDKIQYLFRNYYDRMMHSAIYLDGHVDEDKLKEACKIMLDRVPVLRSAYKASAIKPYWKVFEVGNLADKVVSLVETKDADKNIDEFLTSKFESTTPPQFRCRIAREKNRDVIGFLVNHQCFDGGDFKNFVGSLCEVYNDLLDGGDASSVVVKNGTRSNEQVYSTMPAEKRKKAKRMYKNVSKTENMIKFPLTEDKEENKAMIVKHKISASDFDKLKAYGKKYNATINDILLAGYFRALHQIIDIKTDEVVTIPCMVDLRKHMTSKQTEGFCNLTCLIPVSVANIGDAFNVTLKKVHDAMDKHKKDEFLGLSSIPLLELAYRIAPNAISEKLIKSGYTNPYIGMSNIGILDDKKLVFGKLKTVDCFMTGAIKYKPYMQVALTSFRKEITLTICIYGNKKDREIIENFFDFMDKEFQSIIK